MASSPPAPNSVTIALETSSRPASIAIRVGDGPVKTRVLDDDHSHASDLMAALAALVESVGRGPSDIDHIAMGTGPGSYTGLRVGSATALGLGVGRPGAQLVGVPSFEAIALSALEPGERAAVVRNAFGGSIYVAAYGRSVEGLVTFQEPMCCAPEDAKELLEAERLWLTDEAGLGAVGAAVKAPAETRDTKPDAGAVLQLAATAESRLVGADAVKPLYLRPFDVKPRSR